MMGAGAEEVPLPSVPPPSVGEDAAFGEDAAALGEDAAFGEDAVLGGSEKQNTLCSAN